MELNGRKIAISSYTSAVIDDNTIIYNEVAERIVVLNDSDAFIWEKIVEMSQQEIDLITQEIANKICQEFNIRDIEFQSICTDVDNTIQSFFDASLLFFCVR